MIGNKFVYLGYVINEIAASSVGVLERYFNRARLSD
jgi:hypothetical protein